MMQLSQRQFFRFHLIRFCSATGRSHVLFVIFPRLPLPLRRRWRRCWSLRRRRRRRQREQRAALGIERRDVGLVVGEEDTEGAAGPQRFRLLGRSQGRQPLPLALHHHWTPRYKIILLTSSSPLAQDRGEALRNFSFIYSLYKVY